MRLSNLFKFSKEMEQVIAICRHRSLQIVFKVWTDNKKHHLNSAFAIGAFAIALLGKSAAELMETPWFSLVGSKFHFYGSNSSDQRLPVKLEAELSF